VAGAEGTPKPRFAHAPSAACQGFGVSARKQPCNRYHFPSRNCALTAWPGSLIAGRRIERRRQSISPPLCGVSFSTCEPGLRRTFSPGHPPSYFDPRHPSHPAVKIPEAREPKAKHLGPNKGVGNLCFCLQSRWAANLYIWQDDCVALAVGKLIMPSTGWVACFQGAFAKPSQEQNHLESMGTNGDGEICFVFCQRRRRGCFACFRGDYAKEKCVVQSPRKPGIRRDTALGLSATLRPRGRLAKKAGINDPRLLYIRLDESPLYRQAKNK